MKVLVKVKLKALAVKDTRYKRADFGLAEAQIFSACLTPTLNAENI